MSEKRDWSKHPIFGKQTFTEEEIRVFREVLNGPPTIKVTPIPIQENRNGEQRKK